MKKITVLVVSTPTGYKLAALDKADLFAREVKAIKHEAIKQVKDGILYRVTLLLY